MLILKIVLNLVILVGLVMFFMWLGKPEWAIVSAIGGIIGIVIAASGKGIKLWRR